MSANSYTNTSTLSNGSFALSEDAISQVTQTHTTSNCGNARVLVKLNSLEGFEVNLHGAILATCTEVGIRVTT
jgi:hypothetical protein